MKTAVSEIVRYCREANTFGALLFCGEWGIGKTWLLEHEAAEELRADCELVRISLFGETSVESVRRKVAKEVWFCVRRIVLGPFPATPEFFVPEPMIGEKRLVLVFDDLERTNLSQVEILGCINEYCENLHIKTIVVANEEKLESLSSQRGLAGTDFLLYSQMKEKLIDRTVRLEPDFAEVVGGIVTQYRPSAEGYLAFLGEQTEELAAILSDSEIRNIRSLRAGIRDFERIYLLCREEQVPEEEMGKYFRSFVLFSILAKAGKISKSPIYGYGLNRLQQKYPGHYYDRCMPDCLKDGILQGEWREDEILAKIRENEEFRSGRMKPVNQLRRLSLTELDDETVEAGWAEYLEMAYEGKIGPEEYLFLLQNLAMARRYGYQWPSEPDAERLMSGAETSVAALCDGTEVPDVTAIHLEEEDRKECTPKELALCDRLTAFLDGRMYLYRIRRREVDRALSERDERGLYACRNLEIDVFDRKMAREAMEWYQAMDTNQRRLAFAELLLRILAACRQPGEVDYEDDRDIANHSGAGAEKSGKAGQDETLLSMKWMKQELLRMPEAKDKKMLREIAVRSFADRLAEQIRRRA